MEYVTLYNALWVAGALLGGLGWRWVDSIQKQLDRQQEALSKLKEKVLEEYAKKTDLNDGDLRILEKIRELDANVQRIYDKLDGKKDKDNA